MLFLKNHRKGERQSCSTALETNLWFIKIFYEIYIKRAKLRGEIYCLKKATIFLSPFADRVHLSIFLSPLFYTFRVWPIGYGLFYAPVNLLKKWQGYLDVC